MRKTNVPEEHAKIPEKLGQAEPTRDEINLARTEALDKFFADHSDEWMNTWDYNFIASIKDWQTKKMKMLTSRQAATLFKIYDELESEFIHGTQYEYKNFLR